MSFFIVYDFFFSQRDWVSVFCLQGELIFCAVRHWNPLGIICSQSPSLEILCRYNLCIVSTHQVWLSSYSRERCHATINGSYFESYALFFYLITIIGTSMFYSNFNYLKSIFLSMAYFWLLLLVLLIPLESELLFLV